MLPARSKRVEINTRPEINQGIQRAIARNVSYYAEHPEEIDDRLKELDEEWDIERMLEANAASIGLAGVLLGAFADRRFLLLPTVVTGFLLQHALQGWCPPVPFFRRRGVRTEAEINQERTALKAIRGDFDKLRTGAPKRGVARGALRAARA